MLVVSRSFSQFRLPTGRVLKVLTRMFCPSFLHMAERILQPSHCQAIGFHALIAIRPIRCVTAKAEVIHLTLTVTLHFRRYWSVTGMPNILDSRNASLGPSWRRTSRSRSHLMVIVSPRLRCGWRLDNCGRGAHDRQPLRRGRKLTTEMCGQKIHMLD